MAPLASSGGAVLNVAPHHSGGWRFLAGKLTPSPALWQLRDGRRNGRVFLSSPKLCRIDHSSYERLLQQKHRMGRRERARQHQRGLVSLDALRNRTDYDCSVPDGVIQGRLQGLGHGKSSWKTIAMTSEMLISDSRAYLPFTVSLQDHPPKGQRWGNSLLSGEGRSLPVLWVFESYPVNMSFLLLLFPDNWTASQLDGHSSVFLKEARQSEEESHLGH